MKLSDIFNSSGLKIKVARDVDVQGLAYDSRKVQEGFAFFAVAGFKLDGNEFIRDALQNGARVVFSERDDEKLRSICMNYDADFYAIENIRKMMAMIAKAFYGNPSKKLELTAVTGTNGKTTITYILKAILEEAGFKTGLIGTISYQSGSSVNTASLTTPEAIEINSLLNDMAEYGMQVCIMEASSVAIELDRVTGLGFDIAIFTNLTSEHLDYHTTMQNYFEAKKKLFDDLKPVSIAVSNYDDFYGSAILANTEARRVSYSMRKDSDYRITDYSLSLTGSMLSISHANKVYRFESKLTGKFNLYNIAAAVATAFESGIDYQIINTAIKKIEPVEGRFNFIGLPNGAYAIVDYSHTSDSLKNAIESAIDLIKESGSGGRILTVFGCGGNKDKNKRPVMGKYASELSDHVIVTSDNPRYENPDEIIDEIFTGIKKKHSAERITDREQAIKHGIEITREGDLLLICGKGHETYQEANGVKNHFDDKEMIEKYKSSAGSKDLVQ